jgi:metal-responsive CopG/Arc/MetJ family transcriptional regulator
MQAVVRKQLIVPIRVPAELAARLDRAVSRLHYTSRNEFIREAIEQHVNDRLESKMIEVRDVSVKDATKMIDRYLAKNPGAHYVSELAEELGLELDVAFKAAKMLEAQGMVKARS